MTERVALVTGAARGIGAATVHALLADGWRVVAVDACADDPAFGYPMATVAELDAVVATDPALVRGQVADVRDVDALRAVAESTVADFGGLDAAVGCAGAVAGGMSQWELPLAQERALLDVNLGGWLALARVAIPALLRRPAPRAGRLVAVASAAATRGLPQLTAYCAAKAGVVGSVRALAVELASSGVTVNAVSPGSTDTAMLVESARLYGLDGPGDFATQQPLGRLVEPAEVAGAIAYLLSERAAAVTGAVLAVDGGLAL